MRLRSTHLVFMVLLLCSVQLRDDFTLQLVNDGIARRPNGASQRNGGTALPVREIVTRDGSTSHIIVPTRLDSAGWTAHRTVWTMRRPARAAASVSNHTSMLRA
ncbi:hypothetical protein BH10ACI4_BH10ACI4_17670 [soil metagenome]